MANELVDEISEPFFKSVGVAFVEVEGGDDDQCDLCEFARKNPVPPAPTPKIGSSDHRWGVLHDTANDVCLCGEKNEEDQHAFHLRCIRTFVHHRKARFRDDPACPVCENMLNDDNADNKKKSNNQQGTALVASAESSKDEKEEELTGDIQEEGKLFGKKRKRDKLMYSCWVHVIQATGLKLKGSDRQMSPVAFVSAFGKTLQTPKGDHGKTYSCVWDVPFSYTKKMDIDEFAKQSIEIRIEDHHAVWMNELIGFVRFNASSVHSSANHEFYRQWTPIVQVASSKKDRQIGMQGKLQVSVCVLSEEDIKQDPRLPIHVYDLEVQMWKDMEQKKEVQDYDINSSNYLEKKLQQKQEQDAHLISELWDIIHVRIYRGEDLPKVDKSGWCDGYVELDYKGLLGKGRSIPKTKTIPKSMNPVWNHEFEIPIVNGAPVFFDRFDLILKDENKLNKDEVLGRCRFSINDILKLEKSSGPVWKNLYQDLDGHAPTYRGRILVEFFVESAVKDARVGSQACMAVNESTVPQQTTYRVDVDIMEGLHLPGEYNDYQVDVSLGHPMLGSDARDIEKGGHCWVTFDSVPRSGGMSKKITPFLTRKSIMVHNLPLIGVNEGVDSIECRDEQAALGYGYSGPADRIPQSKGPKNFTTKSVSTSPRSMLPDLLIYVSKKGNRNECVGYLRIPMDSIKRPTENWEHGEDLTIFPDLFNPNNTARCLPLKPLKEMYEAICGFLLFRVSLTPVSGAETTRMATQCVTTPLEPVKRQRYKFVANIYQAKDLASVDESGLSSPLACVQLLDKDLKTRPKMSTCFPQWMEALTDTLELPLDLRYAPDITVTLYHYKHKSIFRHRDPSIFMGKAEIPAYVATASGSQPAWYPLQFEEHQYGDVLVSFRLAPEKDLLPHDVIQSGINQMIDKWQTLAVDVSALTIRGSIATKIQRSKKQAVYHLECWDNEVQTFSQAQAEKGKITVMVRKPENPVFYSSINVRVFEEKELVAVTSIPIDKILSTYVGWYRLLDVLTRTESFLSSKVIRMWKKFVMKKRKPLMVPSSASGGATTGTSRSNDAPVDVVPTAGGDAPSSPLQPKKSKFAHLRDPASYGSTSDSEDTKTPETISLDSISTSVKNKDKKKLDESSSLMNSSSQASDVAIDIGPIDGTDPDKAKIATTNMLQPRNLDENGHEVFDEKDLVQVRCERVPDKDPGNKFEMHWRVDCEYELLPLTKNPFLEFDLNTGKDEVHQTFLEKLFTHSKHSVGILRGNFFAYPYGKNKLKNTDEIASSSSSSSSSSSPSPPASNVFDAVKYNDPSQYCVRVYLLRGLQLICKKGRADDCDSFMKVFLGSNEDESFKTEIKDNSLNPNYYKCFDFNKVVFPAVDTILNIQCWNDAATFGSDLIGETKITLENRLFSTQWNTSRKPIERRALFQSKSGRLPMGFIEVCVDIIPQHLAGDRPLDYLLSPPVRLPWELRVTMWNTKNVTPKKIYKHDGDCCCYDLCAPPNQSDIKLVCGMSGSQQPPQGSDVHLRSIDGEGNFNWRAIHEVMLPSPEPLSNLKIQVWNINWNPDDCIAEAVIPLWAFFEYARRSYEAETGNSDKWVFRIPKQWVPMKHPQNSDKGDVEISVELLPKDIAVKSEFKAAAGEKAFKPELNAPTQCLQPPNRPDSSFPWYRIDLQILWRCKYCFKKSKKWIIGGLLLLIILVVGIALAKHYTIG